MENDFKLQKAESKDSKYKSPALSLFSAVSGLFAFGGMICLCAVLLTQMSGGNVNANFFLASFVITILGSVMFTVSSFLYKKGKSVYLSQRKEMIKSAKKFEGRIIGVTKFIKHVKYMKDTFDEIVWRFKIEYNDDGEVKTVFSDKYLNDISNVLKSDKVNILALEDNTLVFKNYQLRHNENEPYIKLETEEIEQETEL